MYRYKPFRSGGLYISLLSGCGARLTFMSLLGLVLFISHTLKLNACERRRGIWTKGRKQGRDGLRTKDSPPPRSGSHSHPHHSE
jgi:hypothetical protein